MDVAVTVSANTEVDAITDKEVACVSEADKVGDSDEAETDKDMEEDDEEECDVVLDMAELNKVVVDSMDEGAKTDEEADGANVLRWPCSLLLPSTVVLCSEPVKGPENAL